MHKNNWMVVDPDHKWYGKKVQMVANVGRGAMSSYLIYYGTQEDWVTGDVIEKINVGKSTGRPKKKNL